MKTSVESWWSDTVRRREKCWQRNLPYCHFVHYNSGMDWPGIEPVPSGQSGDGTDMFSRDVGEALPVHVE